MPIGYMYSHMLTTSPVRLPPKFFHKARFGGPNTWKLCASASKNRESIATANPVVHS